MDCVFQQWKHETALGLWDLTWEKQSDGYIEVWLWCPGSDVAAARGFFFDDGEPHELEEHTPRKLWPEQVQGQWALAIEMARKAVGE